VDNTRIKYGQFLDQLRNCQLISKDCSMELVYHIFLKLILVCFGSSVRAWPYSLSFKRVLNSLPPIGLLP
jgi:hypothetical protein